MSSVRQRYLPQIYQSQGVDNSKDARTNWFGEGIHDVVRIGHTCHFVGVWDSIWNIEKNQQSLREGGIKEGSWCNTMTINFLVHVSM